MPITLYGKIAEDIVQKIASGHYPIGSVLPAEMELMTVYGASRNTVRSALQQLQAMGLVSRRRNRGTTVEAPSESARAFSQSLSSLESLVSLANAARRKIIGSEEVVMDILTARQLGCVPGTRWLRLSMVRTETKKKKPLGWTDAYVDSRYAEVQALAIRSPDKLLSDLIEQRFGRRVESVEQTVHACILRGAVSNHLETSENSAALRVVRRYRDAANALVIATQSWYPEARYSLSTTLVRQR